MGSYEEKQFAMAWQMLKHLEARVHYVWNRKARHQPCGARTRTGLLCRARGFGRGHRCKNHGGGSTGPRTPEGKARIAELRARSEGNP